MTYTHPLVLGLLLEAVLFTSQVSAARLTLAPASVAGGSTIAVPLTLISEGAQISALQMTLSVTPGLLTNVDVSVGPVAAQNGKALVCNPISAQRIRCLIYGLDNHSIPDGVVALANITASATAAAGSTSIGLTDVLTSTPNGDPISIASSSWSISITQTVTLSSLTCSPTSLTAGGAGTCTVTLAQAAPAGGATVSIGSSTSQSIAATLPASAQVPAGASSVTFPVSIQSASAAGTLIVSASLSGITKTASIAVTVPVVATLSGISCAPASLAAGSSATCTATLTANAPAGGRLIALTKSSPANISATVPSSVTVASGASSTTFTVSIQTASVSGTLTISGTLAGVTKTTSVAVTASVPVGLGGVSCSAASLVSGEMATCTVILTSVAPAGGTVVSLAKLSPATITATVPASVTVSAGTSSRTFSFSVQASAAGVLTISGTLAGVTRADTIAITMPASLSAISCSPASLTTGGTATCTASLTAAAPSGGSVVTLTKTNPTGITATMPSSVSVPAGQSSAVFPVAVQSATTAGTLIITGSMAGIARTDTIAITAPTAVALKALSCPTASLTAGGSTTCTVSLTGVAPSGGTTVAITKVVSSGIAATIPASVTIPSGSSSASFPVQVQSATTAGSLTISASLSGVSSSTSISIATAAPPALSSIACSPSSVTAGGTASCTVTLSQAAASGDIPIALAGNAPPTIAIALAPTVTIKKGSSSATFPVQVVTALASGSVSVSATLYSVTKTAAFDVTAQTSTCSFSLGSQSLSVPAEGGRVQVALTASAQTCAWTAHSDSAWAQVQQVSGTGPAAVDINVFPSFTTLSRSATIHIGGKVLEVSQSGSGASENERFVRLLYHSFLGRTPSPDEVSAQVAVLTSDLSKVVMTAGFFNSPEFDAGGRFVAGLYVGLLNRDPEFSGWLYQRDALVHNPGLRDSIVSAFLNTPEFLVANGRLDDPGYVRLLYRQILLREANPAEVAFQADALKTRTRAQLASGFLSSEEFRNGTGPRLTAFLMYATLLQRDGAPAERDSWATLISGGLSVPTMIDSFVKSAEFAHELR